VQRLLGEPYDVQKFSAPGDRETCWYYGSLLTTARAYEFCFKHGKLLSKGRLP
jgi:hypothetical protein